MSALRRIDELGPESLCDAELLAIVIGGNGAERVEAAVRRLLAADLRSPSLASDLPRPRARLLRAADVARLLAPRARRLLAALELGRRVALGEARRRPRLLRAADVARLLAPRLAHLDHEEFWAVLLTARLEEIRSVRVSQGGITHCSVLPREAFAPALRLAAPCVAFAHNHPSGDPRPSGGDQRMQALLEEAGRALGIDVVDHLVVTARGHHSAREGFLSFSGDAADAPAGESRFPIAFTEEDTLCPKPS